MGLTSLSWSLRGCLRYPDRHWPDMDCLSRRLHVHPHAAHGWGKAQAFLFPLGEKHIFCVFLMIAIPLSYAAEQSCPGAAGFEPASHHFIMNKSRLTAYPAPGARAPAGAGAGSLPNGMPGLMSACLPFNNSNGLKPFDRNHQILLAVHDLFYILVGKAALFRHVRLTFLPQDDALFLQIQYDLLTGKCRHGLLQLCGHGKRES